MPAKKIVPKKLISKSSPKKLNSQSGLSLSKPVMFAFTFAVVGVIALVTTLAAPKEGKLENFVNNPGRGWVWDGLEPASAGSVCPGGIQFKDPRLRKDKQGRPRCTHGPDPAPEDVDVKTSVQPVQTGEADSTAITPNNGGTTSTALTGGTVPCDGDGQTGNRIQLIYAHASDVRSRYSTYASSFQTWASNINNTFVQSGLETGQARNVRFVTDANCNAVVTDVTLSATGDDNMSNTELDMQSLGFDRSDRKYLIWMDANVYCGIGDIRYDDSPGATNMNNDGRSWARVDSGCWGASNEPEAHELMHTLGGVQPTAPHASYAWHCTDDYDRMCYQDNPNLPGYGGYANIVCNNANHEVLYDCNHDDYFTTGTPPADNYLATHWNAANSSYLFTPATSPSDTVTPTVTISKPLNGAKIGSTTAIAASATDNVKVAKMEIYIDGVLKAPSSSGSISYSWKSAKASPGTHTITVKAYDAVGNIGQSSVGVTK